MSWNPFKNKTTPAISEAIEYIERLNHKIRVPTRFDELGLDTSLVGSKHYERVPSPYVDGIAYWKDEPTERSITLRCVFEKGASMARHLHAQEVENIYVLSGKIELLLFKPGKTESKIVDEDNRYFRIPPHLPHKAFALETTEFLCTFTLCRK